MPSPVGRHDLTGSTRYRSGFRGTLVLQVEESKIAYWKGHLVPGVERTPVYEMSWRDAEAKDLRVLEYLQHCMDAEARGTTAPAPVDR